ncbi:hypothetical protein [Rhodovarius crocodyli]|nr:hypothetical protein [Rhodovarius crocodyli]
MSDSPKKNFPEQEEQYPAREEEQQEQPMRKQPGEGGPKTPSQKY